MPKDYVSATDLATLVRCPRKAALEAKYGKVDARATARARLAGDREHARHHLEALAFARRPLSADRRCFIATAIYGEEAWQTEALRRWRDQMLLPSPAGRLLVHTYYIVSPPLARWLPRHPRAASLTRRLLDRIVRWIISG
ncbi:hypothetical protein D6833_12670 [Candidatus Parcubacteria bacterium]|nr:MAG: hypothetical protein D6833_12670 [Candidatus Parcubacteria bacterium]